jgi:hypothetical protein
MAPRYIKVFFIDVASVDIKSLLLQTHSREHTSNAYITLLTHNVQFVNYYIFKCLNCALAFYNLKASKLKAHVVSWAAHSITHFILNYVSFLQWFSIGVD